MASTASRQASLNGLQDRSISREKGVLRGIVDRTDCAELAEQCSQEALREDISSWQLMAFTVAKLRSGLRTGFIHGWSGVPSRHENNSTGVRPQVGKRRPQSIPAPSKLKS